MYSEYHSTKFPSEGLFCGKLTEAYVIIIERTNKLKGRIRRICHIAVVPNSCHRSAVCCFCFFTGYIYSFASSASKKLSKSVTETAQTLRRSVEEGKINEIIDKVEISWFLFKFKCFQPCLCSDGVWPF